MNLIVVAFVFVWINLSYICIARMAYAVYCLLYRY